MARRQDQAFAVCRACQRRYNRWVEWQPTPESGRAAQPTGAQLRTAQARECRSFSRTSNSATAANTWAGARYHRSTTQQPVYSRAQRSTHPPPLWLCLLHYTTCLPLFCVLSIRRLLLPLCLLSSACSLPLRDRRHHQPPQRARRSRALRARQQVRRTGTSVQPRLGLRAVARERSNRENEPFSTNDTFLAPTARAPLSPELSQKDRRHHSHLPPPHRTVH